MDITNSMSLIIMNVIYTKWYSVRTQKCRGVYVQDRLMSGFSPGWPDQHFENYYGRRHKTSQDTTPTPLGQDTLRYSRSASVVF